MNNRTPEEIIKAFYRLPSKEQRQRLLIIPDYGSAYQEIVKPNQATLVPNYFLDHWGPLLGSTTAVVYLNLRKRCYYHFSRKETDRDVATPKQETIAREAGVKDTKTVRRALTALENYGLISREKNYRKDPTTGEARRSVDSITVFFDIPLIPDHLGPYLVAEGQRAYRDAPENNDLDFTGKNARYSSEAVDNSTFTGKNARQTARENFPSNKTYSKDLDNNVNVGGSKTQEAGKAHKGPTVSDHDIAGTETLPETIRGPVGPKSLREASSSERFEAERALDRIKGWVTDYPKSRRFYEKAAIGLGADTIHTIVSDLEALERDDNFRGWKVNRNAALVHEMNKAAATAGIQLRRGQ